MPPLTRYFAPGALVTLAVFVLGRLALEPVRVAPQFDAKGMDPYGTVEKFQLRKRSETFRTAIFGSSVSIWGILSDTVAEEMQVPPHDVRKLAIVGGTPFDHWKLIERNPAEFDEVRLALIELNPRMMHPDLESDERVRFTISQFATWEERGMLRNRDERYWQRLEMVVPFSSVRRSLYSAALNVVDPVHGTAMYPKPDARLLPFIGWHVPPGTPPFFRDIIPAHTAARRLVGNWRHSRLQDECLRQTLDFFRARKVRIILYQLPVHPDVADQMRQNPQYAAGYAKFLEYVDTLGVPPGDRLQLVDIEACGAPVEAMRDLTHFNELGAGIYSRWLGRKVGEMTNDE